MWSDPPQVPPRPIAIDHLVCSTRRGPWPIAAPDNPLKTMKKSNWLAVGTCTALLHLSAAAAPFTNGGFEAGTWDTVAASASGTDIGFGPWLNVSSSKPASVNLVTGWVPVSGGDFSWHQFPGALAVDGTRVIDLNGNNPGGIEQTFDTVAGRTYVVSFSASRHFLMGPAADLTVSALPLGGGVALAALSVNVPVSVSTAPGSTTLWTTHSLAFTATGPASTLRFASNSATGGTGPMVDNVQVVAQTPASVPVFGPGALVGLSVLLGGLGLLQRRKSWQPAAPKV